MAETSSRMEHAMRQHTEPMRPADARDGRGGPMSSPRPFVDFYTAHGISPVAQNISDLRRHFQIRDALYRHLGIPPRLIAGASVVEFGPGSGHNALFTQSLGPARYLLVDANPTGIARTRALLAEHRTGGAEPEIVASLIQEFRSEERFDLVLCEGVIPTQRNPADFLRHVAGFAAPGGVVVLTCMDSVSYLSELLRRLLALALTREDEPLQERVERLLPVFGPHLDSLRGMTRPHGDWIMDNLLQPFHGPLFSMAEAMEALRGAYSPHGSSPHFLADWRWHKTIHDEERLRTHEAALDAYAANVHSLLDHRQVFAPRAPEENRRLVELCDAICACVYAFADSRGRDQLEKVAELLEPLASEVGRFSPDLALALRQYLAVLRGYLQNGSVGGFQSFASLFGRGQQYLSFIREG